MKLEKWVLGAKILFIITIIIMYCLADDSLRLEYFKVFCGTGSALLIDAGKTIKSNKKKSHKK